MQTSDPDAARREMEVNYFGTLNMTRAFAPLLGANDVHATEREHGPGEQGELCHTMITFV